MKCKNFFRGLVFYLTLLAMNTFAQDYVAIAHVIYDGNGLFYADNEKDADLKFKPLTKGDNGTFDIKFTDERLKASAIGKRRLRFGLKCTEETPDCETYLNPEIENKPLLKELFPDYEQGKENQPIYEVWVEIGEDGKVTLYDETNKPSIAVPTLKTIRFFAPWTNTGVKMHLNGTSYNMTPIEEVYCGWFEKQAILSPKDVYVYFKQSLGEKYIGAEGLYTDKIDINQEILLDSILKISDTVWVLASMYSEPELYSEFPEELGDCPIKKLPVMMFDWLHGKADNDTENRTLKAGTTSQDFGTGGCKKNNGSDITKGMVESELGPNGVPVRANPFPEKCEYTDHLDNWFIPESLAVDSKGNKLTNSTCRDLYISLDSAGFWLAEVSMDNISKGNEANNGGMFLLDNFQYLDSAKTVPNPYYDSIFSEKYGNAYHNYGFTMAIQAQFEYVKGQYFEFLGDDDVWVFINNKLVVDIGGQHMAKSGSVNLDTLGLTEGETYPFRIFYAERHNNQSNFKMRTSMDLKAEASMLLQDVLTGDPKIIKKDVYEKIRKKALSCDFLSTATDTTIERGPSDFVLFGKALGKNGEALKVLDSAYYNGITISNDFTTVTIDLKKLNEARLLPPGNYYIRVRLRSNTDEFKDIPFTIDPYELPSLAFATAKDSSYFVLHPYTGDTIYFDKVFRTLGDSANRDISSDVLPISLVPGKPMWAGRLYPVNIMYAEEWAVIYNGIEVNLTSSDPNLIVCDSMGNTISSVQLYSGRASFFVKGIDEVKKATLTASSAGAKNASINWINIDMAVPPVPFVEAAYIYDRTGDGRADSIWIQFNKPIDANTSLDYMKFTFGERFDQEYHPVINEDRITATLAANVGSFGPDIFTGGNDSAYSGKVDLQYTYTDPETRDVYDFPINGILTDSVGPVILKAEVKYLKDENTQLTLTFSEGINGNNASEELFRFHCHKNDNQDSIVKPASGEVGTIPANQWKLIFPKGSSQDVVPIVGDSVRFRPPSQLGIARDLAGVGPHENNPFVRITGEQRVTVTSPKVVTLKPGSIVFDSARAIIQSPEATVPKLAPSNVMSAEQAAATYGTQGHFLGDLDMAELVENEFEIIKAAVRNTPEYEDHSAPPNADGTLPTKKVEDIIAEVAAGTISIRDAQKRYWLDPVIVDAYENGLLDNTNIADYRDGGEAAKQKVVRALAYNMELHYETIYYTSLGHFVSRSEGTITCNDTLFMANGANNCIENDGKLYLAWNTRANSGRLVATGVYIARLKIRVKINSKTITDRTQDFLWGFRRGKVSAFELGIF